ncbi:MAG: response regulator transcription factor [Betaproteobacteria bacterium]|jgi:DNA-binding response OmpR family regulator|nr:response regulator transcription factor [Betaproteobacteria bacterium]
MRVLIIEDDLDIATNLYEFLESKGNVADLARDGVSGMHLAVSSEFDAIVLDLGLPGMDGLCLCRKLRQEARRDVPILILTARDVLEDKLAAFDCGADDYLVKPFALREVEARLNALVSRRHGRTISRKLAHDTIEFDPINLVVTVEGRPVHLSRKCLRLLELLISAPNRVYTRDELEQELWGDEHPQSDSLRSHMHLLRRALTDSRGGSPIETVHGIGYRFAAADADSRPA